MDPAMTSLLVVVLPILITTLGAAYTNAKSATKTSVRDLEERDKLLTVQVDTLTKDRNEFALREIASERKIVKLEKKISLLEIALERFGWVRPDTDEDEEDELAVLEGK